jgi:DNA-binding PadR family transcriptional regulator
MRPALHRLEAAGLLRSSWAEQAGRHRRLYELTAKGVSALADLQNDCENDHLTGPGRLVDGGGRVGAAPLGE